MQEQETFKQPEKESSSDTQTPEQQPRPEREQREPREQAGGASEDTTSGQVASAMSEQSGRAVPPPDKTKSPTLQRVETILEDDLDDVYASLDPQTQKQFKEKGEETAVEIESMLYKVKVKSKQMLDLLLSWLRIIPGVSQYFLKQEAKLKRDRLMEYKKELDEQRTQNKK